MAQTSDRISSLAAKYVAMPNTRFHEIAANREDMNELAYDVRSMSASLLRQDQHRGLRGFLRKVTGQ